MNDLAELATYLIWLFVILLLIHCYAYTRKGKLSDDRPFWLISFTTTATPEEALRAVLSFALQHGYDVEDMELDRGRVMFGEAPNWATWGFFYPIRIADSNGTTVIEVGMESRLQVGPRPRRHHERLVNGIKCALWLNSRSAVIS